LDYSSLTSLLKSLQASRNGTVCDACQLMKNRDRSMTSGQKRETACYQQSFPVTEEHCHT
jgi:hypothetical protein